MHPSGTRPLGPRAAQRSTSPPPPYPIHLTPVAPLNIRKTSRPQPTEPTTLLTPPTPPLSRSPTPKLGLQIPSRASPAPSKPSLKLNIAPLAVNDNAGADSPSAFFLGGYYGGPSLAPPPVNADGVGETTIRPSTQASTKPPSMDDLRRTVNDINDIEYRTASAPPPGGEQLTAVEPQKEWSDDVLEEISRLGEGAGGAVHEVRDKRTGILMARKTIPTREAPMKQLLRELNIITSISNHVNIIHFFGAYMSPSSSEVKVLMEICEGKSLEAVGKRIKERGARVGEKVAGRLAEGVRDLAVSGKPWHDSDVICFLRLCKVSTSFTPRNLFIATSNPRISFSPAKAS